MDTSSTALTLSGLSGTLHTQFTDWLDRRKPQEEEMLRCYQDNMRIPRDNDTTETGISRAQKSKVFIGSTRGKIRSARAKIKDALFGAGQMPFDTKPSNEKLKEYADTVEAILENQFEEGNFKKTLTTGVDAICVYGTGFIFGPFVKKKTHTTVQPQQDANGLQQLQEVAVEYDCPYYEHGRTMDCYPDPEAEDVREGIGIYWASRKTPEFIRGLKGKDGYSDKALDRALIEKVTSSTSEGSDRLADSRVNLYRYTKEGRIWFLRYFGLVKRKELDQWRKDNDQPAIDYPDGTEDDEKTKVECVVIQAGGQVVKAELNPYKDKKRPVRRCVYEDVEHEMWGVGIAKNNDPHQRVTNAAFRLFIEGKAYALLKMFSADRGAFEVTEDFKLFPGKRFQMKPNLTPDQRKDAIIWHDTADVTEGWESLIALSEQFSDDDTGITKYTQGDDAKHLNDTATGISMIMNASSLPIKEVLSNIDEMWIEEMIEDLLDWDMENLEPETVKVLLGDKHAQNWATVKQYGKTNFMEWFATGSQTFMAKEVLMHKLQGFLTIVLSSEIAASKVDVTELLQQVWDAGQIGKESPVLSEEDLQKQSQGQQGQEIMQHAQQAIDGVKQQAQEAIQQANQQAKAAQEEAAKAGMENQMKELAHQQADLETQKKMAKLEGDLAAEKMAAKHLQDIVELEREMFRMKELVTAHDTKVAHDTEKSSITESTQQQTKEKSQTADAGNAAIAEALKALAAPRKKTATIKGESGRTWTLEGSEMLQ